MKPFYPQIIRLSEVKEIQVKNFYLYFQLIEIQEENDGKIKKRYDVIGRWVGTDKAGKNKYKEGYIVLSESNKDYYGNLYLRCQGMADLPIYMKKQIIG